MAVGRAALTKPGQDMFLRYLGPPSVRYVLLLMVAPEDSGTPGPGCVYHFETTGGLRFGATSGYFLATLLVALMLGGLPAAGFFSGLRPELRTRGVRLIAVAC